MPLFKPFSSEFACGISLFSMLSAVHSQSRWPGGHFGGVHSDLLPAPSGNVTSAVLWLLPVPKAAMEMLVSDTSPREDFFLLQSLHLTVNQPQVPRRDPRDLTHPCPVAGSSSLHQKGNKAGNSTSPPALHLHGAPYGGAYTHPFPIGFCHQLTFVLVWSLVLFQIPPCSEVLSD